jgi:hypothetical protein
MELKILITDTRLISVLLLTLASTAILRFESHETTCHILLFISSGRTTSLALVESSPVNCCWCCWQWPAESSLVSRPFGNAVFSTRVDATFLASQFRRVYSSLINFLRASTAQSIMVSVPMNIFLSF